MRKVVIPMDPEFRPIEGFSNYWINRNGTIRNFARRRRLITPTDNGTGHLRVTLTNDDGEVKHPYVSTLVASTFMTNFRAGTRLRVVNGDLTDVRLDNLQIWSTPKDDDEYPEIERRPARRVRVVGKGEYASAEWAARAINGSRYAIYMCLRGERRSHKGYKFEWVGE